MTTNRALARAIGFSKLSELQKKFGREEYHSCFIAVCNKATNQITKVGPLPKWKAEKMRNEWTQQRDARGDQHLLQYNLIPE